jgi:hypothetical protein
MGLSNAAVECQRIIPVNPFVIVFVPSYGLNALP